MLVATACSAPPEGRAHWTLALLADAMVSLIEHDSLSAATIGCRLADNDLKPWQKKMWCVPKINTEYVARMADVLDLYAEPQDCQRPVVCLDESPTQLIGEAHEPIAIAPGQPAKVDYDYVRNGTANLFVMLDAHQGWRHVKVTEHRANADFALCLRELVDVHYPEASCVRRVVDNLSTHSAAALYDTFEPAEAGSLTQLCERDPTLADGVARMVGPQSQ